MLRSVGCVSSVRSAVIWVSFVLAMAGWSGSLAAWVHFGTAAGVRPSFIVALSLGITFTITCCHSIVMPDKARMFALGWMRRDELCTCHFVPADEPQPQPQPRPRLELVEQR